MKTLGALLGLILFTNCGMVSMPDTVKDTRDTIKETNETIKETNETIKDTGQTIKNTKKTQDAMNGKMSESIDTSGEILGAANRTADTAEILLLLTRNKDAATTRSYSYERIKDPKNVHDKLGYARTFMRYFEYQQLRDFEWEDEELVDDLLESAVDEFFQRIRGLMLIKKNSKNRNERQNAENGLVAIARALGEVHDLQAELIKENSHHTKVTMLSMIRIGLQRLGAADTIEQPLWVKKLQTFEENAREILRLHTVYQLYIHVTDGE